MAMAASAYHDNKAYTEGLKMMESKDYSRAACLFTKAIFLFPNQAELYKLRGDAYLAAFDVNSATANYKKAVLLMQQEKEEQALVPVKANLMEVLDWQGCTAFCQGKVLKAYICFAEAVDYSPTSRIIAFHRGVAAYKLGEYAAAGADFHRCASEAYIRPFQWVGQALTALKDNHFKAARKYIQRGKQGYASNVAVNHAAQVFRVEFEKRRTKAADLIKLKQFEDAGRILDDLVDAEVDDAELYQLRATCLSSLGMYSAAVQDLFESISKAGGSNSRSEHQLSSTLVSIAEELTSKGHANQAMEYFTEAIKWNPSVPQYFLNRGDCYHRLRKHERALLDYKHVLDLDSGNQEALAKLGGLHNEWGAILFNKGEVPQAEAEFSKAIAYQPHVSLYYFHRAQCRLMDKDTRDTAIADLMKCNDLGGCTLEMMKVIQQYCPIQPKPVTRHATTSDGVKQYTVVDGHGPRRAPQLPGPRSVSLPARLESNDDLARIRRQQHSLFLESHDLDGIRNKANILMQEQGFIVRVGNVWEGSTKSARPAPSILDYNPYVAAKEGAKRERAKRRQAFLVDAPSPSDAAQSARGLPKKEPKAAGPDADKSLIKKRLGPSVGELRSLASSKKRPPARPFDAAATL